MNAQQLKNSILQMAVQGKLVPQDPNDEPASVLLERIRAEKERLIKEKKIKREKNPSIIFKGANNTPYEKIGDEVRSLVDEVPFEIPESWEWVRLGAVLEIARGGSPRPIQQYLTTEPDGINWIKIGDTDKGGKYIYKTKEKIRPEGVVKSRMVHSGDFLLTNSMSFGRPYILKTDGCIHDGWLVLSNRFECYSVDFLYYILSSPFAYYQFCNSVSGAVVKNLNSDKVANALFPLPPLAEQQRIADLIERLVPYVHEYGKAESAVDQLNCHFPEALKKSILQEAVQGKLVPQNPNDEPASVLLERIRAEKQRLIKEGKIKKDKHESVIFRRDNSHYEKLDGVERCIDGEIPFEIPENWRWVRLGTVIELQSGQDMTPDKYNDNRKGIPYITGASNIENGKVLINRWTESGRAFAYCKDILLTCKGTVGTMAILQEPQVHIARQIMAIRPVADLDVYYIQLVLDTLVENLKSAAKSMIPGITREDVLKSLFPVPPISEQHRIVQRIEELLPLIKGL